MRSALSLRNLTAVSCIAAVLSMCSTEPLVDGGTHTGNPDISACASAVFDLMGSSAWHIEEYLDTSGLDPSVISAPQSGGVIVMAKTLAAAQSPDSVIYYRSTVLIPDTNYINDTLTSVSVVSDTIVDVSGGDTTVYITDSLIVDSVLVTDTVISVDTVFIVDSIPASEWSGIDSASITGNDAMIIPQYSLDLDSTYYDPADTSVNYVFRERVSDMPVVVKAGDANFSVNNARNVMSMSKLYVEADATEVFVRYSDADGDNMLFSASSGMIPQALLEETRTRGGAKVSSLSAVFHAGEDRIFPYRSDNSVISLARHLFEGGDTAESVVYTTPQGDINSIESRLLTIERYMPNDSVFYRKATFTIDPGTDVLLSSDDRMEGTVLSFVFSRGLVARLQITAVPEGVQGWSKEGAPGPLAFQAVMTFSDGSMTSLSGRCDPVSGISGSYESAGSVSEVTVGPDGEIVLTP